jgi:hypothetical protein
MVRSVNDVNPLVAALFLVGSFGIILFWLMRTRVASTGIPVKYFRSEIRRIIRLYRELAASKDWSSWPIAGYWISAAVVVLLGLILAWATRPNR